MFNRNREGEVMDNVTTVGIDLAKNVFSVHGVDVQGKVRLRKSVSRVPRGASGKVTALRDWP
jgi:transposase